MDRTPMRWVMQGPGKLVRDPSRPAEPGPGEVAVEVAGCGVCHTDLTFLDGDAPTRHGPPLVLGHEVSGVVARAGPGVDPALVGAPVIVPAVLPCGECGLCRGGSPNACRAQRMPGNDADGGFATHLLVPARGLCRVDPRLLAGDGGAGLLGPQLEELAVVADAVTTPYEALRRAEVGPGDFAVFVGVGGVGGFGVQLARALGATVAAVDVDDDRLDRALQYGASIAVSSRALQPRAVRGALRASAKQGGIAAEGWKVFETSGTTPGQELAWELLTPAGTLSVVGYATDKVTLRLSNLMAHHARALGTWGCAPDRYPAVLALVLSGAVKLRPFIRAFALEALPEVIDRMRSGTLRERPVLVARPWEHFRIEKGIA
jgi:6-hydroxycyclohex-1-ene-1-carbonyl-CoA dehydrogenase